jgi:hypothetical protein
MAEPEAGLEAGVAGLGRFIEHDIGKPGPDIEADAVRPEMPNEHITEGSDSGTKDPTKGLREDIE